MKSVFMIMLVVLLPLMACLKKNSTTKQQLAMRVSITEGCNKIKNKIGQSLEIGFDLNRNLILDTNEIGARLSICDNTAGEFILKRSKAPGSSTTCAEGGEEVEIYDSTYGHGLGIPIGIVVLCRGEFLTVPPSPVANNDLDGAPNYREPRL